MQEFYGWQLSNQEQRLVKAALLNIDKRSPHWKQAQAMAACISLEPLPLNEIEVDRRKKGELQEAVIEAVTLLKVATTKQISESINIDVNSINSTVTRLYRKKVIDKQMIPNPEYGTGRGKKAEFVAAYSIYQPGSKIKE